MKLSFTLSLLIALSINVLAQDIILYEDQFNDNGFQWESSGSFIDPVFSDGNMRLKGKTVEDISIVLSDIVLNPDKDFMISCNIAYQGGSNENSFGMVFSDESNSEDPRHYFFMVFPGEGFDIYYTPKTGSGLRFFEYHIGQKDKNLVRSERQNIEFMLKNTGGTWVYYINGNKTWSKVQPGICITSIGFFTSGLREMSVDYMVVKQDGWDDILLADESQVRYEKENLGENINSTAAELLPIISADEQTLFLCVMGDPENTGDEGDQDIWYSTKQPDGTWSKRINIGFPLNNTSANFVNYFAPDNNTLFVGNRYDANGYQSGEGLSFSQRQDSGWSIPTAIEIDNYYNLDNYISVSYAPTGKTLVLSIEREDTYGQKDLYVSHKKSDGTWTEPLNMGPGINTYGDEMAPFLAADNTTLYFATNSRPGYGNYDIFITRRLYESWTSWTEPANMGPNINTTGGDAYFTISASGEYSYLVSANNTYGGADIFRVKVAEVARPNAVALISGQVFDQKTLQTLEALITYYDLETNEEIGTARSNPKDGTYQIALESGRKYSYFAKRGGYYPISENIDLTGMEEYTEIKRDLYLVPIEVGGKFRLNNIFFEFDKSNLLEASVHELDRLVKIMKDNPAMTIRIEGHTDHMGSDEYNQKLSEDRARAVYTYLQGKGFGERASSIGYGESKPIASNDTDEGRAQNRRVEFVILEI